MASRFLTQQSTETKSGASSRFLTPVKEKLSLNEAMDKQFPSRVMVQNVSSPNYVSSKPKVNLRDPLGTNALISGATARMDSKTSIGEKAKQFIIPNRGFTDKEISSADPTGKEKVIGSAKAVGEVAVGLGSLLHMGGNQALRVLPFYDKEDAERAKEAREKLNEKIEPFITPKTAGEAQIMRIADIAGFAVGWTKVAKLSKLKSALVNVDNVGDARKVLRSGDLPDDVITRLNLDKAAVNIKNIKEADRFVKQIDDVMTTASKASTPTVGKAGVETQPTRSAMDITPSRTPTPGAQPRTPRFAQGANTMFKGADVAQDVPKITTRLTAALSRQAQDIVQNTEKAELDEIIMRSDDLGTATASEYLNKLARDYDATTNVSRRSEIAAESARVVNAKATRLSEAGREIQAASLLSRLTPEGQLRYIAGKINRYNRSVAPKKRIPELDGKQAKEILDEMDDIRKTIDPTERQMKFFKLQKKVQGMFPSSFLDKTTQLWKAGLLTGIKTLGLNVFSSGSHLLSEYASSLAATGFDKVFSVFTGNRTTTATMRGALSGIKEGSVKGKRYFFTGFDERNIGEKLDYKRVNFGKGRVGKLLQAYTDQVFQTIGATDQPFYYSALARSYMDQALATAFNEGLKGKSAVRRAYQIVDNPTEEMMENAVRDATTAIFTNDTILGTVAKGLQKTPLIGQFVVPFARTPSAVATQIMNYTPTGAVAEIIKQIYKGKFDQRAMSKALGRSTLGTIPLYIGWQLAEDGRVSLQYPAGDTRQIELDKAEGVAYNSIKVGDEWRNPITLGPAGLLLLMGAHIRVAMEKSGSPNEAVTSGALGLYETLTEQTFMTGLTNFTSMIEDLQTSGKAAAGNFVASFIPTIISDIARVTDDSERRAGTVGERISKRIPGARQQLEPNVDILGREEATAGRGGEFLPDFFESMADPTRPSQDVSTDVTKELSRLMKLADETKNSEFNISPTRDGLYGYEVLTGGQETRLQKVAGQMINTNLQGLFNSPQYKQASDEDKVEAIDKLTKASKDAARARIVLEILGSIPESQRAKALKRMDEDGLITRDVMRVLNAS